MTRKKKYFIWIIIIAVVAGGFFYLRSKKPRTTYTTQEVKRGYLAQTVSVTGKLFAPETISVSFKTSGRVDEVYVDVGNKVKKGDKIAKLGDESLLKNVQMAEKDVIYQQRVLDDMRRNKNTYGGKKREAQVALVRKYQDALAEARFKLGEAVIYAPISGTVIALSKDAGENAMSNEEVAAIAGIGALEIQSNIPESDIVSVRIGQKAKVTFDAFSFDEIFEAEVIDIDPASTVIQDVVYYRAKLKLAKPDERLRIGMSEDLDILTASKNDVLMIPMRAIKTEGAEKFVEILRDEERGIIEKLKVGIGMSGDDGMVEVTDGGLKEGDRVITLVSNGK